ncbi:MAG: Lrp/AsnC ligand binding domain-containing protein [Staphylothermus sp.]|nr:Lrp/AsnC ligand binding domain-containing protein [Staphylothermus sp.]
MKVFEKLSKIPEVKEVYVVYGIYDVIAKIEANSLEKIREIIINRIRRIPEIRTTSTMVIVEGTRK